MKNKRQSKILSIVNSRQVRTHDELIDALRAEGVNVTQATVSRDIKELGIIKVPSGDGGAVYAMVENAQDAGRNRVDMVSDSIKRISCAYHTVVINTFPGMASAVAAAVDTLFSGEILGSVAGDDTIIIVTPSPDAAKELDGKIRASFKL